MAPETETQRSQVQSSGIVNQGRSVHPAHDREWFLQQHKTKRSWVDIAPPAGHQCPAAAGTVRAPIARHAQ